VGADRFRTPRELADTLEWSLYTTKGHHLPSLVDAGHLELRYPDTPNHPAQAYHMKQSSSSLEPKQGT